MLAIIFTVFKSIKLNNASNSLYCSSPIVSVEQDEEEDCTFVCAEMSLLFSSILLVSSHSSKCSSKASNCGEVNFLSIASFRLEVTSMGDVGLMFPCIPSEIDRKRTILREEKINDKL